MYELILNEDLTYSIATPKERYGTHTISSEQYYYVDKGSFNINVDTLFLVTSHQNHLNQAFIFELDFKNQKMDLYAPDEEQISADIELIGDWYKINRFSKRIGIRDVY